MRLHCNQPKYLLHPSYWLPIIPHCHTSVMLNNESPGIPGKFRWKLRGRAVVVEQGGVGHAVGADIEMQSVENISFNLFHLSRHSVSWQGRVIWHSKHKPAHMNCARLVSLYISRCYGWWDDSETLCGALDGWMEVALLLSITQKSWEQQQHQSRSFAYE